MDYIPGLGDSLDFAIIGAGHDPERATKLEVFQRMSSLRSTTEPSKKVSATIFQMSSTTKKRTRKVDLRFTVLACALGVRIGNSWTN